MLIGPSRLYKTTKWCWKRHERIQEDLEGGSEDEHSWNLLYTYTKLSKIKFKILSKQNQFCRNGRFIQKMHVVSLTCKQKFCLGEWKINEKKVKFKNKSGVSEAIPHWGPQGKVSYFKAPFIHSLSIWDSVSRSHPPQLSFPRLFPQILLIRHPYTFTSSPFYVCVTNEDWLALPGGPARSCPGLVWMTLAAVSSWAQQLCHIQKHPTAGTIPHPPAFALSQPPLWYDP